MTPDHCICTVEVSPGEVDAGADLMLKIRVTSPNGHDLSGRSVSIRNQEGFELARADLVRCEGETYATNDIVVAAPCAAGEHLYRTVLVATDKEEALPEDISTEIHFTVKAHAAQLNVWGMPSAIVAGERFRLTVGIKCSCGCKLTGRSLSIFDHEGSQVGATTLSLDVWPGTEALYFAEVEAEAPMTAGDYKWEIKTGEWYTGLPHAAGAHSITVKVVNPPECEVTVEAIDKDKQTPIKGARVVMHPYRGITDENGIAKVKVTKGQYDLLVSGSKYVPVSTCVEVTADMITKAELSLDPPWEAPDELE